MPRSCIINSITSKIEKSLRENQGERLVFLGEVYTIAEKLCLGRHRVYFPSSLYGEIGPVDAHHLYFSSYMPLNHIYWYSTGISGFIGEQCLAGTFV